MGNVSKLVNGIKFRQIVVAEPLLNKDNLKAFHNAGIEWLKRESLRH